MCLGTNNSDIIVTKTNQPQPCKISVDITDGEPYNSTAIFHNGIVYTEENIFILNGRKHGCICKYKTCIRKCCLEKQNYNGSRCVNSTRSTTSFSHDGIEMDHSGFYMIQANGKWCNGDRYRLSPHVREEDIFQIQQKGHVVFPNDGNFEVEPLMYCIEYFRDVNYTSLIICHEKQEDTNDEIYMHESG